VKNVMLKDEIDLMAPRKPKHWIEKALGGMEKSMHPGKRDATGKFDRTDYSVVVKSRGNLPNPWKWEIYRAGRSSPIKQSPAYFPSMAMANRAGKEALKRLLEKLYS
jgi:hypothetical protein